VHVLGLFDGSTIVNLAVICAELFVRAQRLEQVQSDSAEQRVDSIFSIAHDPPPFDLSRLALTNRGVDDVVDALPHVPVRLSRMVKAGLIDAKCYAALAPLIEAFLMELRRQNQEVLALGETARVTQKPPEMFELHSRNRLFSLFPAASTRPGGFNFRVGLNHTQSRS
jgi:hypothetical protein